MSESKNKIRDFFKVQGTKRSDSKTKVEIAPLTKVKEEHKAKRAPPASPARSPAKSAPKSPARASPAKDVVMEQPIQKRKAPPPKARSGRKRA